MASSSNGVRALAVGVSRAGTAGKIVGQCFPAILQLPISTVTNSVPARAFATKSKQAAPAKNNTKLVSLFDLLPDRKSKISLEPVRAEKPWTTHLECIDGNEAAAHIAYAMSDVSFIYPITPSSPMGELADAWTAAGRKNIDGQALQVTVMQSEAGAAGAVHGALSVGAFSTTFTASQGLLLMIPNMYKIAGELTPTVFHVSARSVAGQALSIFGDHGDVMAVRQTGFALLCANTVQEVMDLALVSHIATVKSSVPFCHFFDGFRTSHEISKVDVIPYQSIMDLVKNDKEFIEGKRKFKARALSPEHPQAKGSSQGPDVFFQAVEAANPYYARTPEIVQKTMDQVAKVTGRSYHLFDYHGHPQATRVIVIMGSGAPVVEEVVNAINAESDDKVGVLKVRLFRPWSVEHFLAAMPATVKRIAVMDRCKEGGSLGEPLFLDVAGSFQEAASRGLHKRKEATRDIVITGGRYALGQKDFTPPQVMAVFQNLAAKEPRLHFTVGIEDDVSNLSLPMPSGVNTVPAKTVECLFWGMGSDGTVGANKEAITLLGENTNLYVQGYFQYDAHKSGGVTISHLRFGPSPITSHYLVQQADYVACHHSSYMEKYNVLGSLKPGGVFVLNTSTPAEEVAATLPAAAKRQLAATKARFYVIDARKIAEGVGLGKRINMIMQVCFFALAKVIPLEQALGLLKTAIAKTYGKKGQKVVDMNVKAVDQGVLGLVEVPVSAEWANAEDEKQVGISVPADANAFVKEVMVPLMKLEGDNVPVSKFEKFIGGLQPTGQTQFERRAIASSVPFWLHDKCTQCNYCSFVCPHACIRPSLQKDSEEKADRASGKAPKAFISKKATGKEAEGMRFSVNVSPYDCTGCTLCVKYCPDQALEMRPITQHLADQDAIWQYTRTFKNYGHLFDKTTIRGSQFQEPLLEFSGACEGCGETPYVKLLTQLFGSRAIIANATGCSSIWGNTYGSVPYTTNQQGKGPAWGNSLFEDAAEYGFGMAKANRQLREKVVLRVGEVLALGEKVPMSAELRAALGKWQEAVGVGKGDAVGTAADAVKKLLTAEKDKSPVLQELYDMRDSFVLPSHWIIGGDGFAYDIGYGGLDHVLAAGEKVNILVLDTELYSNTGGQKSKSTPMGAVCKFAASGARRNKKDLGLIAMQYGDVYVASVALGANMSQLIRAFVEADSYPGTSLIIAWAPCMVHGSQLFQSTEREKMAVESGYWPLYRYNPVLRAEGKNPMQLDSKKIKSDVKKFLDLDLRYNQLMRSSPQEAADLNARLKQFTLDRFNRLKQMSEEMSGQAAAGAAADDANSLLVLYGSETGNSETLANRLIAEGKRRGLSGKAMAMDDFDFDKLAETKQVVTFILSTCGQGKFPINGEQLFKYVSNPELKAGEALKNLRYSVFGLGDSNYVYFCKAAIDLDKRLQELGATRVVRRGVGNDQDEDKFETGWEDWEPEFWAELKAPQPPLPTGPPAAVYEVTPAGADAKAPEWISPPGSTPVPLNINKRITPLDYDRDIRHMEFDLKEFSNMSYNIGDCLAIYGQNDPKEVEEFLSFYGIKPDEIFNIASADKGVPMKAGVIPTCSAMQLFSEILDMNGRPSRRFYTDLALFATNPEEKAELLKVKTDKACYKKLVAETTTFADVLRKYPSAKPSLGHLVHMIPVIKPRYYSIASSNRARPDTLELCVVLVDWKTPSGRFRKGLTTNYISRIDVSKGPVKVNVAIRKSAVEMPPNWETPVIMAGLGTGIAPFRAFVQEHDFVMKQGEKIGPMYLYFGCRKRSQDLLYVNEFEAYEKAGSLTKLRDACSRDQEKKIYVQNRILEDAETVYDLMVKKGGYFYICGPARQVPEDVRRAVRQSFMKAGGMTEDEAEKLIVDMQIQGRYNVEAWS